MDCITTSPERSHTLATGATLKEGRNGGSLENILVTRSKEKKFLDLLAAQRAKKSAAQFHEIDLSHANLSNLDLSDVDLTGANLTNTNLSGAKLIRTNLTNAKLIRTKLVNANLAGTILTNAQIDRITQLSLQHAANQKWYETVQKCIPGFNQKWEKLKSVDGFNAFEMMLKQTSSQSGDRSLKNSVTTAEMIEIIETVIQSPDVRPLIFQATQDVKITCHANVLTALNTVQGLSKFGKLFADNAEPQEMLALAKAMVRQNLLDEATLPVMRNQWQQGRRKCNGHGTGPNVSEALKVRLALRHQLAQPLRLPFPVKSPANVSDAAALDHSDKEFVTDYINQCMSDQHYLTDALLALPMWRLYLSQHLSEQIKRVESLPAAIDNLFRQETEKML